MHPAPVVSVDLDEFWNDPYPQLKEMRNENPICFVPELGAVLVTKRDDIQTCEKNVTVFSSDQPGGLMNVLMGQNMMRRDGDDHRKERFVYYPAVSPNAVKKVWATQFESIVDSAIEVLATQHGGDLVRTFATIVSGEALKVLTGLTNASYHQIDGWSQAMIDGIANYEGDSNVETRCHEAVAAIDAAIDERLPAVLASPDHSLLSIMVSSGMPMDTVRANIKLTISGGQNEPRDAIGGMIWALLTHPDQLELVERGIVGWMQVFDEYCRLVAPIGMSPRRISTDFEYNSVQLRADDRVFLMFSSANRDEDYFDRSAEFDVQRDVSPNLTFGAGPHFCAGAAASRSLIGDIAVPKLFARFPNLTIDESEPDVVFGGWAFRGPLTLPARW